MVEMHWLLTDGTHWALALLPALLLLATLAWLDAFALMSLREVSLLLAFGAIAAALAYPLSGRFLDALPIGFSAYSRFVAPWIEEALKGVVIAGLFAANRIGFKLDAVISGFAVGTGFALVENILYLSLVPGYGWTTWLVRGMGTAVMHGSALAISAAIAHQFAERAYRRPARGAAFRLWWFGPGFLAAVIVHTAFNQFAGRPLVAMLAVSIAAPLILLGIFQFATKEAERWLAADRADHRAQLDALQCGAWPDSPSARRIAALASRSGDKAQQIRRLWELRARLAIAAEDALIDHAAGRPLANADEIRAAFEELRQVRRTVGRCTLAAIDPLLPFSRNDDWELDELRQRIGAG